MNAMKRMPRSHPHKYVCGGTVCRSKRTASSHICQHRAEIAKRNCKDGFPNLAQGAFQALRGFLQLVLESIDLLRYIIELFLSQRSCPSDLLNFAIRLAHGCPNSYCNSREPILSGHLDPPLGN